MGLRFQRRIRLFKGLTANLSKSGVSWTLGGPGASINFGKGKTTGNLGIPGTGLSYRQRLDTQGAITEAGERERSKTSHFSRNMVIWLIVGFVLSYLFTR